MPNLTSYRTPAIHLNQERPKTYCELRQHEFNYVHFLRTRISNIKSSLSSRIHDSSQKKKSNSKTSAHKQWQRKIESENKRFIRSLVYRYNKYQSSYDQYSANKDYQRHLKLMKSMSQYPCDYKQAYPLHTTISVPVRSDNIPFYGKLGNIKLQTIKHDHITNYLHHIFQDTMKHAIRIYSQPFQGHIRNRNSHNHWRFTNYLNSKLIHELRQNCSEKDLL